MSATELFPVFLKLDGKKVLLVGGGPVAAGKLLPLLRAGAAVTVIAPDVRPELRHPGVRIYKRRFRAADVGGAWLVVAAATPTVNRQVRSAAEARGVFVNAVDDPAAASAYLGGVLRRPGLIVAVSTEGKAPALAGLLREGLEALIPADYPRWLEQAGIERRRWKAEGVPMARRRPLLLRALNHLYRKEVA